MKMRILLISTLTASSLLLSGCWINEGLPTTNGSAANGGGNGVISSPTTVRAVAANQVNTRTTGACDKLPPQDINSVTFTSDDTSTDVSTLNPRCTP